MLVCEMRGRLPQYMEILALAELSRRTLAKYRRSINSMLCYFDAAAPSGLVGKETAIAYKKELLGRYSASTVNSAIIPINGFLGWLGCGGWGLKMERVQRAQSNDKALGKEEYGRLTRYALLNGYKKYYYIMRVLAGTGIRVGELKFITVESAREGRAVVRHKNKTREICIPDETARLILRHCKEGKVGEGVAFCGNKPGEPLTESCVWKMLKRVAKGAGVDEGKVYPHSFRRLFAKTYMAEIGNIAELADLLGHSSIETTRLYAATSHSEKRESLGKLDL